MQEKPAILIARFFLLQLKGSVSSNTRPITASRQTNMHHKHHIKRCKQQKLTLKKKLLGQHVKKTTIAIRFKLLQVCSFAAPFVFAFVFYTFP